MDKKSLALLVAKKRVRVKISVAAPPLRSLCLRIYRPLDPVLQPRFREQLYSKMGRGGREASGRWEWERENTGREERERGREEEKVKEKGRGGIGARRGGERGGGRGGR